MTELVMTPGWLHASGFDGFVSIHQIRSDASLLPREPGVYVVFREDLEPFRFLAESTGGWFKGQDPSVRHEKLEAEWVDDAHILYIGKAGAGKTGNRGIRARLTEYVKFGEGRAVGHRGGRYLWHLPDTDGLQVCWKVCTHPSDGEASLLEEFRAQFGRLPFANLVAGRKAS